MANIFLTQPAVLRIDTEILGCRRLAHGSYAVLLAANPLRPAGGGQPRDYGVLHVGGRTLPVEDVRKDQDDTVIVVPHGDFGVGEPVTAEVDAARRMRLSQAHSLGHLAMASLRELVPGYVSKGADIAEDGVSLEVRFLSNGPVSAEAIRRIDRRTRSRVLNLIQIRVERVRDVAEAAARYAEWRIDPDLHLSGKIRVVVIEGVDANPCSGSHVTCTSAIGPYEVTGHSANAGNLNRLRLSKRDAWTYWY